MGNLARNSQTSCLSKSCIVHFYEVEFHFCFHILRACVLHFVFDMLFIKDPFLYACTLYICTSVLITRTNQWFKGCKLVSFANQYASKLKLWLSCGCEFTYFFSKVQGKVHIGEAGRTAVALCSFVWPGSSFKCARLQYQWSIIVVCVFIDRN